MADPSLYPNQPNPEEHVRKQSADMEMLNKISKNVNNLAASLRIIEERFSTLRNKSQVSEQNIIEIEKSVTTDIKMLSDDIVDLKHNIKDIKDKLTLMKAEMGNLVNKNDFKIMERYLDMWQPMNFVTRNELNNLLKDKKNK